MIRNTTIPISKPTLLNVLIVPVRVVMTSRFPRLAVVTVGCTPNPQALEKKMGSPIEAGGHTVGPWIIKQFGGPQISGPNGYAVATMWGALSVGELRGQDLANARLIAASPDLLEAAMIALSLIEGGRIYEQQCCDGKECGCRGSTYADEAEHFLRKAIAKATGGAA